MVRLFWSWKRQLLKRRRRSRDKRSPRPSVSPPSGVPDRVRGHASPPRRVPVRVGVVTIRRRVLRRHRDRPVRTDPVRVHAAHRRVAQAGGRSLSHNPRRSPSRVPRHALRLNHGLNPSPSQRVVPARGPSRSRAHSRVRASSRRVVPRRPRPSLRRRNLHGYVRVRRVPRVLRRARRLIG